MQTERKTNLNIILPIIFFVTLTRIAIPPFLGHPPNFSAMDATALFCGAYFNRQIPAILTVIFSIWIGDIIINKLLIGSWTLFYSGFIWQYSCYVLITLIGTMLKNRISVKNIFIASLSSAFLFFIISNFGVWISNALYPLSVNGLITCYIAAIPFFKNTLASDLFFSVVIFGVIKYLPKTFFKSAKYQPI